MDLNAISLMVSIIGIVVTVGIFLLPTLQLRNGVKTAFQFDTVPFIIYTFIGICNGEIDRSANHEHAGIDSNSREHQPSIVR